MHLNRSPGPLPCPPPPLSSAAVAAAVKAAVPTQAAALSRRPAAGGGKGGGGEARWQWGGDARDNVVNVNDKRPRVVAAERAHAPASRAKLARAVGARGTVTV